MNFQALNARPFTGVRHTCHAVRLPSLSKGPFNGSCTAIPLSRRQILSLTPSRSTSTRFGHDFVGEVCTLSLTHSHQTVSSHRPCRVGAGRDEAETEVQEGKAADPHKAPEQSYDLISAAGGLLFWAAFVGSQFLCLLVTIVCCRVCSAEQCSDRHPDCL